MSINFEHDLVLITCAAGNQASALLPLLHGKWKNLRLAAHSEASATRLQERYPDAEVVQADMLNPAESQRIMEGVTAVYHVGPSGMTHEAQCGFLMIDAAVKEAKTGSFKHFVYSSVASSQLNKLLNHECKREVEEYLMESGLNYTILQPSHLFENTPIAMFMAQDNPVYPMAYNPDIKHSFTAMKDLSDAAALVIEQRERHFFATYPIVSTLPTAYTDFLEILGKAIGKPILIERKPFEDGVKMMNQRFNPENDPKRSDIFERILWYYNRRGIWGNPSVTEWLLQRKATGCEEWAALKVATATKT